MQAEQLIQSNRPDEAIPMLLAARNEEPGNEKVFLYLAFSYEQVGKYDKAVEILKNGINSAVLYKKDFYLNLGNNYFKLGQSGLAEEMFSQAILTDSRFSEAYLNRANSRMKLEAYDDAIGDYRMYLSLEPNASQREKIERLISLLTTYMADAEQRRIEEEQRRIEEAQRQQKLLESVMETLDSISGDTTNLSADTEDIIEYEDGLDILD